MLVASLKKLDLRLLRLLARDSTLAGLGAGFSRLFVFILNVLVSRILADQVEYGVFSTIYLAVNFIAVFASLGLSQTAARSIAAEHSHPERQQRTTRTVLMLLLAASFAAGLFMLIAATLIAYLLRGEVPVNTLRVGGAVVCGQLFAGGVEGVLRGLRRFAWIPLAAGIAGVAALGVAYSLISHWGVIGGLVTLLVFLIVQVGVSVLALRGTLAGRLLPLAETGKLLGLVAAPTFLSGLAWNIAMMIPPFILVRSRFGLEHMALWNATSQLRFFISFAPIVIVNTSIPHLSKLYAEHKLNRRQAATSVGMSMAAALLPYLPVVLFASRLLSLYGPSYTRHGVLLTLVATFVLLQVIGVGLFGIVLAAGRVWQAAVLNCAWAVVVLAIAPTAIARSGAYSLAYLYIFTYLPVVTILGWLALRAVSRSHIGRVSRMPTSKARQRASELQES